MRSTCSLWIALVISAPEMAAPLPAQTLAFDVASIHADKSGSPPAGNRPYSNFPLGPDDVYVPNGGYFKATNQPLLLYITFA
jgi:hypothetical protein